MCCVVVCRYLDMEPQLRNLAKDIPPCSETGMARRILPVLALNEVSLSTLFTSGMYSIDYIIVYVIQILYPIPAFQLKVSLLITRNILILQL